MKDSEQRANPTSLDRVRGDRGLTRRSGFIAQRARELADDVEVVFPDKNLESAVRETLEMSSG